MSLLDVHLDSRDPSLAARQRHCSCYSICGALGAESSSLGVLFALKELPLAASQLGVLAGVARSDPVAWIPFIPLSHWMATKRCAHQSSSSVRRDILLLLVVALRGGRIKGGGDEREGGGREGGIQREKIPVSEQIRQRQLPRRSSSVHSATPLS